MKKLLLAILVLGQLSVIAEGATKKMTPEEKVAQQVEVKKFSSLKDAGAEYAKAMAEVANFGSREMLQTVNKDVDEYIKKIEDPKLAKQWNEVNNMLIEQFEVSVYEVKENGDTGQIVFLIKGYDEDALNKYLTDNTSKYATVNKDKDEVDVDIDEYIRIEYNYLKTTPKINLATSTVNFKKENNQWKVIQEKK
ncbi:MULTISPECIES: hypothetical protein [unclassified Leptotrichia]|jgi:hypothetical protein|uniref:hypothetical protein n=1 Tax=unclassified Leptotrichia TaxID=2633022 RepID=UPI0018530A2E|nr:MULTISPECIES: hypothetical protein [unclassified Leptotrichia]MBB1534441.1 hypothetical protein [Leptotrichia sp.]QUB96610.1 hypothetical protein J4863_05935 [Leptotrichia sp. oral taxon 221]